MSNPTDNLTDLMRRVTTDLEPESLDLYERGLKRGQTLRRRRTVRNALAGSAAVLASTAVLFGANSVFGGTGRAGGDGPVAGQSASSTVRATAPATSATTPAPVPPEATQLKEKEKPDSPPPIHVADLPVKAAEIPRLFSRLHPGKITPAEWSGRIVDDGRGRYGHFLWNGFATSIGFVTYSGTPEQRCRQVQHDKPRSDRPLPPCSKRSDGTVLLTEPEMTFVNEDGGVGVANSAWLFTKDGYEITAISYNSARIGRTLAEKPPFSTVKLVQAVTSRVWF